MATFWIDLRMLSLQANDDARDLWAEMRNRLSETRVEIVTGVNLPMVIKLASQNKETTLTEMAKEVEEQGKQAIYRTSLIFEPQKAKKDA